MRIDQLVIAGLDHIGGYLPSLRRKAGVEQIVVLIRMSMEEALDGFVMSAAACGRAMLVDCDIECQISDAQ